MVEQNKTEEKLEDLDPEVQESLRQYFVKQIQDALKNNRYDLETLRIIYYLISNDEKIDHNEPVKPIHYSERILRERAKKLGYTVKRSYVRVVGGRIMIYGVNACDSSSSIFLASRCEMVDTASCIFSLKSFMFKVVFFSSSIQILLADYLSLKG